MRLKNIFNKKCLLGFLRYCLGTCLFVYIAFKVEFRHVDFLSISWTCVTLSILPLLLFILFQGIRFNSLLIVPLKFLELSLLQFKMQFFNLVFPSSVGGDAYRILVLKHAEKSLISVSSKAVLDRLSGLLFTTIMFVYSLPSTLTQVEIKDEMLTASWVILVACVVIGGITLSRLWQGYELFTKSVSLIFYSFLCWAMQICRLWLLCNAIGLNFSVMELSFMLGILQLASLLPITVGGLGLIEGAFVFAAGFLGVATQLAALGAILMRITTIVSGLFGLIIWLRGKIS